MPKSPAKKRTSKKISNVPKDVTTPSRKVLPGYIEFTKSVLGVLRQYRTVFLRFMFVMLVVLFLTAGLSQQGVYSELTQSVGLVSQQSTGALKPLVEVTALFTSIASGTLSSTLSESQQLYMALTYLLAWLTMVWLLRHLMAGNNVSLRDGLYAAGAPLISTLLIGFIAVVQLLPLAIVAALVSALSSAGILGGWLMIPGTLLLLGTFGLALFWLTTTLFAAIIATIPGTYPLAAFRSARELVKGYRLAVIKRSLWLLLINVVAAIVLLVPVILLDAALGYPFSLVVTLWSSLVGVALFMYSTSYLYLLYREVIDERA